MPIYLLFFIIYDKTCKFFIWFSNSDTENILYAGKYKFVYKVISSSVYGLFI